jgi:hypothetical protein
MSGFTVEGCDVPAGFRPLPAQPGFELWGPDIDLAGGRWVDMWDLSYDSRPGAEALPDNPLRRVDIRHGSDDPIFGRWVTVVMVAKVRATALPTRRWGPVPTSLVDAVLAGELRLNLAGDEQTATDGALWDPSGPWGDSEMRIGGTWRPVRFRDLGDPWVAAVDLDDVYVAVTGSHHPPGQISLTTRAVIPYRP